MELYQGRIDATILIPTFQRPELLRESIASAFVQNYPCDRYEILVVSDGDPAARSVAEGFGPRVRYHELPYNQGQNAVVNEGMRMAHGEYVALQHDDDRSLPDRIRILKKVLDQNPRCAVAAGLAVTIDASGAIHDRDGRRRAGFIERGRRLSLELEMECNAADGSATMYRKEAFFSVGGYGKLPHGEEVDFRLRCWRLGWTVDFVQYLVAEYRIHGGEHGNKSKEDSGRVKPEALRLGREIRRIARKEVFG